MKRIYLTGSNGIGMHVKVSAGDYHNLSQYRWCLHPRGYVHGWYPVGISQEKKKVLMHRVIMDVLEDHSVVVDHKNHDQLDNRRGNLRVVTQRENMQNRSIYQKSNHSKFRAVTFHEPIQKWVATPSIDGVRYKLGPYSTELEALQSVSAFRVHMLDYPHPDDIAIVEKYGTPTPKPLDRWPSQPRRPRPNSSGHPNVFKSRDVYRVVVDQQFLGRYVDLEEAITVADTGHSIYKDRKQQWVEAREAADTRYPPEPYHHPRSSENLVTYNRQKRKWVSYYSNARLGYFDSEAEAIEARVVAKKAAKLSAQEAREATIESRNEAEKKKKLVKEEIAALRRMAKSTKKYPSRKVKRARKQYVANKIRRANGMEPLPLHLTLDQRQDKL